MRPSSFSAFRSHFLGRDRCLPYADDKLPVFAAIREWHDLNVGEHIFAIGQGLALHLSEGMLSGKRTDGRHRLIQTSAPISQGSSGGGLFDSSGRPLGITTFTIDGQNLNVGILAEDWRYALCMAGLDFIGPPPDCMRHIPIPPVF